jgi:hypothetical protein
MMAGKYRELCVRAEIEETEVKGKEQRSMNKSYEGGQGSQRTVQPRSK